MRPRKRDRHLPPCVYLKHGSYWLVRGGKWERLGRDLPTALQAYGRAYSRPLGGMPALIDAALEARKGRLKLNTWKQYKVAARKLSDILAEFSADQVTQRDIVQIRLAMSATPNMANRCISVLRVVFDYALEQQLVTSNPATGVKRLPEQQRERLISPAEYRCIYMAANERLKVIMDLCYLTGQRIGDVLAIRYTDIGGEGITFKQGKTGAKLTIQWTPDLTAVVERAKKLHGNVRAFTLLHSRRGTAPAYRTIHDQWEAACEAAGVEDAHLHDLRAMSGTAADEAGKNATALLGHTSPSMTRRYLRSKKTPVVQGPSFGQLSKKRS